MKNPLPAKSAEFIGRFWAYIGLCALPVLVALALYIWKLGSLELSSSHEDWGHFSDFLMPVVTFSLGLGNLFLLYLLTRIANDLHERSLDKELTLQQKSLEKQLKFDLYKDFVTKLDDYTIRYLSNHEKHDAKIYLALIHYFASSAKDNFNGLVDDKKDSNNENFQTLCDELSNKTKKYIEKNDGESLDDFTSSITKIKTKLFQQAILDTND